MLEITPEVELRPILLVRNDTMSNSEPKQTIIQTRVTERFSKSSNMFSSYLRFSLVFLLIWLAFSSLTVFAYYLLIITVGLFTEYEG
jgi:hypothetical protein